MNSPKASGFLDNYKSGQGIGIFVKPKQFDDEHKSDLPALTPDRVNEMFDKIASILKSYGFELDIWGATESVKKRIVKRWLTDKSEQELQKFYKELEKDFPTDKAAAE